MRLLPKREVESSRMKEQEDGVVRSMRIAQVFDREKKALAQFRAKKEEMMDKAESDLKEALRLMYEERQKAETELHYAKERRDSIMPTLEALKDSLENARNIVESEREANLSEEDRLARLSHTLQKEGLENRDRKIKMDSQSQKLHEELVHANSRVELAEMMESKNASISEALDKRESKLLRDVERDKKLMAAQVKELAVRDKLLDKREAKLDMERKRLERTQQTLRIAREQFLKEKSHYGKR